MKQQHNGDNLTLDHCPMNDLKQFFQIPGKIHLPNEKFNNFIFD